jgi:hypothetical protein
MNLPVFGTIARMATITSNPRGSPSLAKMNAAFARNSRFSCVNYEGKYSDAESAFREVLETDKRTLGPDHPTLLDDMNNLGNMELLEGHYGEAEKIYRDTVQAKRRVLGPDYSDTIKTMGNLALDLTNESVMTRRRS